MPKGSSNKGNPASKRMTNANRKARRARSWAAGQKRKEARIKDQRTREALNRASRAAGDLTPWDAVKAERARRRAERREAA